MAGYNDGSQRQVTPEMRATWAAEDRKERQDRTVLRVMIVVGILGVLWVLVIV